MASIQLGWIELWKWFEIIKKRYYFEISIIVILK